ncbi:MAG: DUF3783 domain-containing protein [Oscillospiraceae bacterium]|nr:DUF3783 domain-containing protein [Oscillospiraceae bacterium]
MAVETVLMYNCSGEQWAKLRQIFLMLRVRIRPVEADQYGLTLEDLLGRSEEKSPVEEEFSDPMLVFCNLPHEKLDHLLTAMGRAGLPRIALKAMLTPTNRTWTSQQLWTELRQEHEAMQAQRQQKK